MKNSIHLIILFFSLTCTGCIYLEPEFTNQENFFRDTEIKNNPYIYAKCSSKQNLQLLSFRDQSIKPYWITELALSQFEGDSIYNQIELQKIETKETKSIVALLYRIDKTKVDIYYPENIPLCKSEYEKMINHTEMIPCNFQADFQTMDRCFQMFLKLTDLYGRNFDLNISEKELDLSPVSMIAPIGSDIQNPEFFPLLFLENMIFLNKNKLKYSLQIAEKKMSPVNIPLSNYNLTRYTHSIINAEWLANIDTVIEPNKYNSSLETNNTYIDNLGYQELSTQQYNDHGKILTINFSPAIPDIPALKDQLDLKGRFCVNTTSQEGLMAGTYHLIKNGKNIDFEIQPKKGWQPNPGKLWISSYQWNEQIVILSDSTFHIKSKWKRIK